MYNGLNFSFSLFWKRHVYNFIRNSRLYEVKVYQTGYSPTVRQRKKMLKKKRKKLEE